jgi:salicylate hydroxylase
MIHRGDLQAALLAAVSKHREITLKLGARVLDFVAHPDDITVTANGQAGKTEDRGVALLAADGLWSTIRARIGDAKPPRFAGRTAWRALVPAAAVAPEFRQPAVHLWLGRDAHLVHYPVRAGGLINIVAITADGWDAPGWSEPAAAADLVPRFASAGWAAPALSLLEIPDAWLKWGLYDRPPLSHWSQGRAALLGDAAHAMLPYLAQGAAMAIEDAVVAAQCLTRQPDDAAKALGIYCIARRARTERVQRLAARNGVRYHLVGAGGRLRNAAMRMLGGERLLRHYDWLYGWQADGPPEAPPRSRTDRNI